MSVTVSEASHSSGYTSSRAGTNESWLAASEAHLYCLNGSAHGDRYSWPDDEPQNAVLKRIRTTRGTRVSLTAADYDKMDHASLFSWNSVANTSRVSESREAETATANEATAELRLNLRRRRDRSVYLAGRPHLRLPAGKLRPWVVFTPETMCITNNNSRRLFIRVSRTVATGVATYRSDSLYCGRPASVRTMTEQHWIYLNLQIRKRANKSFAGQPYISLPEGMELEWETPIGNVESRSMPDRQSRSSTELVCTETISVPAHLKNVTFRLNKSGSQGRKLGERSIPLPDGELLYRYGASDALRTPSDSSFRDRIPRNYMPYSQPEPSERSISPRSSASQPRRSSRSRMSPATSSMSGSRGTGRDLKTHTVSSDASSMPRELNFSTGTSRDSSRKASKVVLSTRSASPAVVPPSRPTIHHVSSASFSNGSDSGYRVDVEDHPTRKTRKSAPKPSPKHESRRPLPPDGRYNSSGSSGTNTSHWDDHWNHDGKRRPYVPSSHSSVPARSPSRDHSAPVSYRRRSPPTSSRASTINNGNVYVPHRSSRPQQSSLLRFLQSASHATAKGVDFLVGKVPGGIDSNVYHRVGPY